MFSGLFVCLMFPIDCFLLKRPVISTVHSLDHSKHPLFFLARLRTYHLSGISSSFSSAGHALGRVQFIRVLERGVVGFCSMVPSEMLQVKRDHEVSNL